MIPAVTPIASENTNAHPISSKVAGSRSKIAWLTGSELDIDHPKSPWSTRNSHLKYCT